MWSARDGFTEIEYNLDSMRCMYSKLYNRLETVPGVKSQ
jgi:hypothetical protein